MAKKSSKTINITSERKQIGKVEIIKAYMEYLLKNHKQPESMYQFAGILGMKESEVYKHFASFTAIEQTIFESFFEHAISLLLKDKSYNDYDAKNKLLSFYYTFFEILKENRSYVIYSLEKRPWNEVLKNLKKLHTHFIKYIDCIGLETINLQNEDLNRIKQKGLNEIAWSQLLATLKYWLEDDSAGFEKTDLFIEKSLKASFELINTEPLDSVIDLTKFLFREKFSMNN
ncbi:MAG: TetR family transcriptional regulator C-terminal domain-containing protein [Bacteroidota bacterium]